MASDARDEKGRDLLASAIGDYCFGPDAFQPIDANEKALHAHLDTREAELREARVEIERLQDVEAAARELIRVYFGSTEYDKPGYKAVNALRAVLDPNHYTIHGPHTEGET